jgi:membrane fusion protein (multidrug efflux system)
MAQNGSNRTTTVAVIVAVLAVGWAIYETKHDNKAAGGFGPPAMGGGPPAGANAGRPGAGSPAANRGASGAGGRSGSGSAVAGGVSGPGGGMPTPVVTAAVRAEELTNQISAVGTARANEAVDITSKTSNIVTRVRFADGQAVRAGDVLVELDSAQARADLAVAQAAVTESTAQFKRSQELLTTQALSKSQFDQLTATKQANEARLAAARARLEDTVIRAPFSGRVGLRRVSVGSLINPGATITSLDDTSVIKLDFSVPENLVASLRTGLAVAAVSNAYPGRKFSGTVASIDSRVDPTSRSVSVRALLPNKDAALRPGMFLTVDLSSAQRTALVIPEEALVPEQSSQFVFVVDGGNAVKREVSIGTRRPGSVEVVAGLKSGERVVVEGTIRVRDGGPVRDSAAGAAGSGATGGGLATAPNNAPAGGVPPVKRSAP